MKPGDSVVIKDPNHPWFGEKGKLESFGRYGLSCLSLEGWLINLAGHRTYAKEEQLTHSNVDQPGGE